MQSIPRKRPSGERISANRFTPQESPLPEVKESVQGQINTDGLDGLDGVFRGQSQPLIERINCFFADYVVLSEVQRTAVTAWVLAAWHSNLWGRFPHLSIMSAEKRCGKTRLLELLEPICHNAKMSGGTSAPALFRHIKDNEPTLLLDEAQSLSRMGSESTAMLREIFCAGITKTTVVSRCVGPQHKSVDFPIYCPKVLASIGRLDDMLADRCLPILMTRKGKDQELKRAFLDVIQAEGKEIQTLIKEWVEQDGTAEAVKEIHHALEPFNIDNDRLAELLMPLQAVVIALGGQDETTNRPLALLRQYAESLDELELDAERQSPNGRLLAACKELFPPSVPFMATSTLLNCLLDRRDEGWYRFNNGLPIGAEIVAKLLKPYGIKPSHNKGHTSRGYYREHFLSAWERLYPDPDV